MLARFRPGSVRCNESLLPKRGSQSLAACRDWPSTGVTVLNTGMRQTRAWKRNWISEKLKKIYLTISEDRVQS
jgi:hypothetical protein